MTLLSTRLFLSLSLGGGWRPIRIFGRRDTAVTTIESLLVDQDFSITLRRSLIVVRIGKDIFSFSRRAFVLLIKADTSIFSTRMYVSPYNNRIYHGFFLAKKRSRIPYKMRKFFLHGERVNR